MKAAKRGLGERLVEDGLLTPEQLRSLLEEEKKGRESLPQLLIKKGLASEEIVAHLTAEQAGVPYLRLSDYMVDPEIIKTIPEDLARRHRIFPLFLIGNSLTVAVSDPRNISALDQVKQRTGYYPDVVISTESDILRTIDQYYGAVGSISEVIKDIDPRGLGLGKDSPVPLERLQDVVEVAPVIKLVNLLILNAAKERASDIHIEPDEEGLHIRYRIDGLLQQTATLPKNLQPAIISRVKIMAEMDIAESRLPQDGRIRLRMENRDLDLRVSTFPTMHGENVVLRLLDRSSAVFGLSELGFSPEVDRLYREAIRKPYGLVLVTGPTGSGKTSTLYATLSALNSPEKNIITIEDPVEYHIKMIRQSQINPKAGITFATGLRSILRQDPDIIMVGEIRDGETAEMAIQAALTGHLVLSTLHTNDAVGTITRLTDMGIEPFLIAGSLSGVLAQRLVRSICDKCRVPYSPAEPLLAYLGLKPRADLKFYRGRGCPTCKTTGYRGRLAIFEFLPVHEKVRELIASGAPKAALNQEATQRGMKSLRDDGIQKVLEGRTTVEEILRVTQIET